MTLSKENRSTRARRVPLSICQTQIPHRSSQISCSKDETREVCPKRVYLSTKLHDVTLQKIILY